MADPRPIGVFDSGLGGLTVVRSIMDDLPHESVLYFGDTARYPYGPRALGEVRAFAIQIAQYLVHRDVKLIVVACNTATAAALEDVAASVPVPAVGVIEPAVRAAVAATTNGRVGLIGTEATVASGAYKRAFERADARIEVHSKACPLFVEFVERGDTTSDEVLDVADGYLAPLREAGVDTVILGCTHYPLLRGVIQHVMGPEVLLLSSADETASDVYETLARNGLLNAPGAPSSFTFECSGEPQRFAVLGRRFLGPEFQAAAQVVLPVGGG